jgi:hypothetical protein
LRDHYREVVTKFEAEAYFAIHAYSHETRRKAQRLRFRSSAIRFLNSSISGRILLQ